MAHEIETYVEDERKRGVTDSDIRDELIAKGWEQKKIDAALSSPRQSEPEASGVTNGRKYSNLGILFACLSLIVLPIVFGPVGVFFGVKGYLRGDQKRGTFAIVLSVVLAVLSTFVAAYLMRTN